MSFCYCRCLWPACRSDCSGLNDPDMHALECCVLSTHSPPNRDSDVKTLSAFYRKDVLLTLRCLLLQWKYLDRWNKVMQLESHDQQRLGTRYYKYFNNLKRISKSMCRKIEKKIVLILFLFSREADERIVSYLMDNFWSALDDVEKELSSKIVERRDRKLLHRICGIMEVNALNIGLGFEDNEVSALFENACILEHSCIPNCYYTFDTKRQFKITMRAGRLIKKGEHLAIMYTNMLWGTLLRQEHLLTNKYFICECDRCIDPTELGTYLSALKCIGDIGKSCGGTLLPKNSIDITTDWYCNRCVVSISNEQIEILLTNIEKEVDDLLLPAVSRIDSTSITPEAIESLIEKVSNLLHGNHYHLFALKHTLIQLYGRKPNYMLHELTDEKLQRKIEMCEELLYILDRIDSNTMRLTLYTGIVLYELHLGILEQNRRLGDMSVDVLELTQQYLKRGRDAVALNADISQGRKLFAAFEKADEHLMHLIENHSK